MIVAILAVSFVAVFVCGASVGACYQAWSLTRALDKQRQVFEREYQYLSESKARQ